MESIINIWNWCVSNWSKIVEVIAYIIAIATVIVKLTPTQKDDNLLQKIVDFIGKYIALNKNTGSLDKQGK